MSGLIVDPVGTAFMCILYICVGFLSILCNLTNLLVFLSSREFREKYLFFIVLDLGEIVNAISYILTGIGRYTELQMGILNQPHTTDDCFFEHIWPSFLVVGMQLPTVTIIILAIERICAVAFPLFFKPLFLSPFKWLFVAIIPVFATLSLVLAGLSAVWEGDTIAHTGHCAIITSTALWYSTAHFTFIVIAYMTSFWSALIVWCRFKNRTSGAHRLFVMLIIVGISAVLVSIPSVVNIFVRWQIFDVGDLLYSIGYSLPGFLSIVNTVVNFSMRPDVRRRFYQITGIRGTRGSFFSATLGTPNQRRNPQGASHLILMQGKEEEDV